MKEEESVLRDEEMIVGDLDMSDPSEEQQAGDADIQDVAAILIDLQVIFASTCQGLKALAIRHASSHMQRVTYLHLQWADLWPALCACLLKHEAVEWSRSGPCCCRDSSEKLKAAD